MSEFKSREEVLKLSLEARENEVEMYQLNIDNYTLALSEIAKQSVEDQVELAEFRDQLIRLLESEKLEQKKAKIMLTVVKSQVG